MKKSSDELLTSPQKSDKEKALRFPSGDDFCRKGAPRMSEEEFERLSREYRQKALADPEFEAKRLARKAFAPFILK